MRPACTDTGREAHARWFAAAALRSTDGVRSGRQAEYLALRARPNGRTSTRHSAWSAAHDPLQALEIVVGFGWAWVVLGDSRGAERILTALSAAGDGGRARDRAGALLMAGWIEASSSHLEPARRHVDAAIELAESLDDLDLRGRCAYYLAYVVSHHGEFAEALELTDRSRALYDSLDRPWDQAASALFAARAAISAGDPERSIETVGRAEDWLRAVDDPWLQVRGEALLGELARIQRRFDDAVVHLLSAAETSRRLGFLQTEAYQLSSLGRAQCQAGDYEPGRPPCVSAIDKAEATGDVRLAALARVHLGRVLRAEGHTGQSASGPGGSHRLAPLVRRRRTGRPGRVSARRPGRGGPGPRRGGPSRRDPGGRAPRTTQPMSRSSHSTRSAGWPPRRGDLATAGELCAEADQRMDVASHFISEHDRTDAHWVRQRRV